MTTEKIITKIKIDITGYSKKILKELCEVNGLSKSTFYRSWKRKWIILEVE